MDCPVAQAQWVEERGFTNCAHGLAHDLRVRLKCEEDYNSCLWIDKREEKDKTLFVVGESYDESGVHQI